MLRKLTIENFFSIKEPQTLDLTIGRKATDPDGRFVETIPGSGKRFPKVVALFGANASGKTNVLRAVDFLVRFVVESFSGRPGEGFPFLTFLSEDGKKSPTRLYVEMDGQVPNSDGSGIYYYDLVIAHAENRVLRETLRYNVTGRPRLLFDRRGDDVKSGLDFDFKKRDPIRGKLRPEASVISTLAQFAHPFSEFVRKGVRQVQGNVTPLGRLDVLANSEMPSAATSFYESEPDALDGFRHLARKLDLGIDEVGLAREGGTTIPYFVHRGLEQEVRLPLESHGTQLAYIIYPILFQVLKTGSIAVLDELDTDIHPLVLPEIARLFQNPATNPRNAQLVMSSHNATLLEYLVKEEVYFTEKDYEGRTEIFGLQDFRGVRRDDNIYGKYLSGAYGGVPLLG